MDLKNMLVMGQKLILMHYDSMELANCIDYLIDLSGKFMKNIIKFEGAEARTRNQLLKRQLLYH